MERIPEEKKRRNPKRKQLRLFVIFGILLITLPVASYIMGLNGFFLPKDVKDSLLQTAEVTEEPEYETPDYTPTPTPTLSATPGDPTPSASPTAAPEFATVTTTQLKVRSGPGTEYDELTQLTQGTRVEILEKTNAQWYHIRTASVDGYASAQYLSVD